MGDAQDLREPTERLLRHPVSRCQRAYDVCMTSAQDDLLGRVVTDPAVCFGKPTVRGTRIWVGLVLGLLADGLTVQDVLADYPSLSEEDVRACLAYGARLTSGRFVDVA